MIEEWHNYVLQDFCFLVGLKEFRARLICVRALFDFTLRQFVVVLVVTCACNVDLFRNIARVYI
jgi:hypothetical protein